MLFCGGKGWRGRAEWGMLSPGTLPGSVHLAGPHSSETELSWLLRMTHSWSAECFPERLSSPHPMWDTGMKCSPNPGRCLLHHKVLPSSRAHFFHCLSWKLGPGHSRSTCSTALALEPEGGSGLECPTGSKEWGSFKWNTCGYRVTPFLSPKLPRTTQGCPLPQPSPASSSPLGGFSVPGGPCHPLRSQPQRH